MAHFDPEGTLAPHVRRQIDALAADFDRVVVVSTADLGPESSRWLADRANLVRRPNVGYDFLSYRVGLERVGDLSSYDEVAICNDSYVGPLRPYSQILSRMEHVPADFWGLTQSRRISPHLQSFFVVFRPWVVRSKAFRDFWSDVRPVASRGQVIRRFEVGLTRRLGNAGFRYESYFKENPGDKRVAQLRVAWWALRQVPSQMPHATPPPSTVAMLRSRWADGWNPSTALADRALDEARLPVVKIDTLRHDPYGLGRERLLSRCEQHYPDAFDGVRDYLQRTDPYYPARAADALKPTPIPLRPLTGVVGY